MRKRIPKAGPTWLKPGARAQEVTIISEPTHWFSHFDAERMRTIRCGGLECWHCAVGHQRQLRVVIMGVDTNGREVLIELRERHREWFDRFATTVGLVVRIRKMGDAKNSPVEIKEIGNAYAVQRDIRRLVDALGLAPILVKGDQLEQLLLEQAAMNLEDSND